MQRDTVVLTLAPDTWREIRKLYNLMNWDLPKDECSWSLPTHEWTFEDACGLYFRTLYHRDAITDPNLSERIAEAIQAHLEDELA